MNYEIKVGQTTEVTLNPDTFCPQRSLPLSIAIQYEAQHDGPAWSEVDVGCEEDEMFGEIMNDLGKIVREHIKNTKPFACHQFKD